MDISIKLWGINIMKLDDVKEIKLKELFRQEELQDIADYCHSVKDVELWFSKRVFDGFGWVNPDDSICEHCQLTQE